MSRDKRLSSLTRTLLTGVSAGTLVLSQVGCAPSYQVIASDGADSEEVRLCSRALKTRAVGDVETFLKMYPGSTCIAPLLNSLPMRTLGAISKGAVAKVPQETLSQVEPERVAILTGAAPATRPPVIVTSGSDY